MKKEKNISIIAIIVLIICMVLSAIGGAIMGNKFYDSIEDKEEENESIENTNCTNAKDTTNAKWIEYLLSKEIKEVTLSYHEGSETKKSLTLTNGELKSLLSRIKNSDLKKIYDGGFGVAGPTTVLTVKYKSNNKNFVFSANTILRVEEDTESSYNINKSIIIEDGDLLEILENNNITQVNEYCKGNNASYCSYIYSTETYDAFDAFLEYINNH